MHLTTPALRSRPSDPSSPLVVFWSLILLVAFSLEPTQAQLLRAHSTVLVPLLLAASRREHETAVSALEVVRPLSAVGPAR
jgi:hypothetical protein